MDTSQKKTKEIEQMSASLASQQPPFKSKKRRKRTRKKKRKLLKQHLDNLWTNNVINNTPAVSPLLKRQRLHNTRKCLQPPTLSETHKATVMKRQASTTTTTTTTTTTSKIVPLNHIIKSKEKIQSPLSINTTNSHTTTKSNIIISKKIESDEKYSISKLIIVDTAGKYITNKRSNIWRNNLRKIYKKNGEEEVQIYLLSEITKEVERYNNSRNKYDFTSSLHTNNNAIAFISGMTSCAKTIKYLMNKIPNIYNEIFDNNKVLILKTEFINTCMSQSKSSMVPTLISLDINYNEAFRSKYLLQKEDEEIKSKRQQYVTVYDSSKNPDSNSSMMMMMTTNGNNIKKNGNTSLNLDNAWYQKYNIPEKPRTIINNGQYLNFSSNGYTDGNNKLPFCVAYSLGNNSHIKNEKHKNSIRRLYKNRLRLACQFKNKIDVTNSRHEYLTKPLQRLADIYELRGGLHDVYRARGFNRAVKILKHCPDKYNNGRLTPATLDQIYKEIRGFGQKFLLETKQILQTGKSMRLQVLEQNPRIDGLQELVKVYGIGAKTAKTLYAKGFHTVAKLKEGAKNGKVKLTHGMEIGLKYYDDLNEKIPRAEVTEIKDYVKKVANEIDEGIVAECVGSYRRGKVKSGDVDIFLYNKSIHDENELIRIMKKLIKKLKETHFLKDDLTRKFTTSYMGVCQYNDGKHRHIDIKIWTPSELPFALL